MSLFVDLTKGGYGGDWLEEANKDFTTPHMPFWWHFREVLRTSDQYNSKWIRTDGTNLSDDEQRELVALSLLNYAVHTSLIEARTFVAEMNNTLGTPLPDEKRIFEVRKQWKAFYSSLYTSFNALCNIVSVLVEQSSATRTKVDKKSGSSYPWNYTPSETLRLAKDKNLHALELPLVRCNDRLEIRSHLDHYWLIWADIDHNVFHMDEKFQKGYVPLRPDCEVETTVDGLRRTVDDLHGCADDFGLVYYELSVSGGFLDDYLSSKGWKVDYSDYGPPHNGQRPQP